MRLAAVLCVAACLSMAAAVVRAQTQSSAGVITGYVLDQEDRQPLPTARVGVYRLARGDSSWSLVSGMLSDAQGGFRFEVTPGTYRLIISYQTYTTRVLDDVVVGAGETEEYSLTLTPRPLQIQGMEVKGTEKRGSEATVLSKQKKASFVSDAITSEQISKSTDSNAAEALQRVTGLSVVEGKYVFVRGMGERYSSTQVNGATIGTPEPNKRVVPLDIFPAGTLDNVVVQKTYSPDQDAEFGGGVVQLNTKDFDEGKHSSQSLRIGTTENGLRRGFMTYPGGHFDFLGFDDGTRALPDLIRELASDKKIAVKTPFDPTGLDPEQVQAMGRSFDKNWSPRSREISPNYSYSGSYSRPLKVLGKDVGFLGSFSLQNSFENENGVQNQYIGSRTSLTPYYEYNVSKSTRSMLGGLLGNLSAHPANGHTIHLRTLYTRSAEDEARVMMGPNQDHGSPLFRVTKLGYVERGLLSNVLSGQNSLGFFAPSLLLDWSFGYSEAMRNEPNRREHTYEANGEGVPQLSQRNQFALTRIFGEMNEYDRSFHGNLSVPFHAWSAKESKAKAGVAWRLRSRVSAYRRFGFRLGSEGFSLDLTRPPEELLVDENIRTGLFVLDELTRENDEYNARHEIRAGYAMLDLPILGKGRVVAGARVEGSDQRVEARSSFVSTARPTYVRWKNVALLPALNLSWALSEKMNLRAGGSETISRPELREMSPFDMYDYETGFTEVGNPNIKSTPVRNYDLRWELYPGSRELLAVSGFHKRILRPIENFVRGSSGGYVISPTNGENGRLTGGEVEARLGLSTLWSGLDRVLPFPDVPHALNHFGFNVNYSRVESEVRVPITTDQAGNPIFREEPLAGQSTYALNAGLYYADQAYDGSILVSAFGDRLTTVGAGQYPNSLPDIYEHPLKSVDFTVGRKLGEAFRVKLAAENIFDSETRYLQLDKVTRTSRPGRSVSLGLQWKQ